MSTPWQTIAKVNGASFSAGDSVLFKAGCTWREQLTVPSSGSTGSPISFGAYGGGTAPIINGSNLLTSWTTETTVYYASMYANPLQVFRDGARLTLAASKAAMGTEGWWWDSVNSRVYVYDTPAGHTIEASVRNNAVYMTGKTYITLQGLDIEKALQHGIQVNGMCSYLLVSGVTSNYHAWSGIDLDAPAVVGTPLQSAVIQDSTFAYNGEKGIMSGGNVDSLLIQRNVVHHNCLGINPTSSFCGGINLFSDTDGVGGTPAARPSNVIAQFNHVYSNGVDGSSERGYGIWFDTIGSGAAIQYNWISNNTKSGIMLEYPSDAGDTGKVHSVFGNVSVGNAENGILVSRSSHNSVIANNTLYGNATCIQISGGATETIGMDNNIISNNVCGSYTNHGLSAFNGGENDGTKGTGNVYTYNALGTAASNFIEWGAGNNLSTYAALDTAYGSSSGITPGAVTHSITKAPAFTNAGSGDFTLAAGSSAIDAGTNLGATYQFGLDPHTSFPWGTLNQNSQGSGWEIGAFVFVQQTPPAPPTSLSVTVK